METRDAPESYKRNEERIELIPRGTRIKVMADYCAGGFWQYGEDYAAFTAEVLGESELCRALEEWQDWYDMSARHEKQG